MSNFYVVYGEDKSLIDNEVSKILNKLNISDINKYDMDNTFIRDIVDDANYVSMFSNKKVMIIDNCSFLSSKKIDDISLLEEYLNNYNKDTIMIFICYSIKLDNRKKIVTILNKIGNSITIKKGDSNYINDYIMEIINDNSFKIESIPYLVSKTGSNLDNIKNELDKLMIYKNIDKYISNDDIDKIVVTSMEDEIFSLTDSIVKKDINKSLLLLKEFLNRGYEEIGLISMIANQFRFMFQVKRLYNKGYNRDGIAKNLEVNPYRVKFTLEKLYYYSEESLLSYIKKLYELDRDIKLGKINKSIGLEMFIIGN